MRNFKANKSGYKKMLNSDMVRREMERRANKVKARAKANAPVDSGALRDSIDTETDYNDRVVVHVYSNLPYAPVVEADTGYMSEALEAANE